MRLALFLLLALFALPAAASEFHYMATAAPGRSLCAEPPPGWERPDFDDRAWPEAPAEARPIRPSVPAAPVAPVVPGGAPIVPGGAPIVPGGAPGTPGTALPSPGAAPLCTVYHLRRRFDTGPELGRLATLTLRVRYQDGFVAYLNGREVARRRLQPSAPWAMEPHNWEYESFRIPLERGLLRPTGNLVALQIRSARPTRPAGGEVLVEGADGPRIVRGPYLQRIGPSDGYVLLETDLPTEVTLEWKSAAAQGAPRTAASPLGTHHELRFTGLRPATTYQYRVRARSRRPAGEVETEARFHTPPTGAAPLRFAIFGDVRSGHDVHAALVRALTAEDPDLLLMTGDLVAHGGEDPEWENFFDIAAPLLRQVPAYVAIGNHDFEHVGTPPERFARLFLRSRSTAWWSFDIARIHFILLDSESYKNPEQLAWLEADLQAARQRRVRGIFVVAHAGPYSSAVHGDNAEAIRSYVPLYEKYRVSLVISGHDHNYERLRVGNLDYIVSGGGGAELRTPRCGAPGKKPCGPRTHAFVNEHHYIMAEVLGDKLRLCPKRPDGTLLEACPTFPLQR